MKNTVRVIACFLLAPALVMAQSPAYVESSQGLDAVQFDGGLTEVEMGDVKGDGHLDLVTMGDHGSPLIGTGQHGVMVYYGDSAGAWSLQQSTSFVVQRVQIPPDQGRARPGR